MHLLDDVEITYEYQPVEYQPQHSVLHSSSYRTLLKNRKNESNTLGTIDESILRMLCYDAIWR